MPLVTWLHYWHLCLMTMRGKWLKGGVLTALFTSLMLNANHLQITYYLVMLFLVLGIVKLVEAVKENQLEPIHEIGWSFVVGRPFRSIYQYYEGLNYIRVRGRKHAWEIGTNKRFR